MFWKKRKSKSEAEGYRQDMFMMGMARYLKIPAKDFAIFSDERGKNTQYLSEITLELAKSDGDTKVIEKIERLKEKFEASQRRNGT